MPGDTVLLSGPLSWVVVGLLGLILGSFSSAISYRIPRGLSWGSARSACPQCGHVLLPIDLVPFFSWAFLRGRCRYCQHEIGWRYPMIEIGTLLSCLAVQAIMGFTPQSVILILAVPFLIAMISIDIEFMILPDQINIILAVLGVIFTVLSSPYAFGSALSQAAIAATLYAGLVFILGWGGSRLLKKDTLGFGDVKFFAVAGVWLGVTALPGFLILSGGFGVLLGMFWKILLKQERFPFGPALIAALFMGVLFGRQIQLILGVSG